MTIIKPCSYGTSKFKGISYIFKDDSGILQTLLENTITPRFKICGLETSFIRIPPV